MPVGQCCRFEILDLRVVAVTGANAVAPGTSVEAFGVRLTFPQLDATGEVFVVSATNGDRWDENGGVRSPIRTGLDPELPDKWFFTGYFRVLVPVMEKWTRIRRADSIACKQIP